MTGIKQIKTHIRSMQQKVYSRRSRELIVCMTLVARSQISGVGNRHFETALFGTVIQQYRIQAVFNCDQDPTESIG